MCTTRCTTATAMTTTGWLATGTATTATGSAALLVKRWSWVNFLMRRSQSPRYRNIFLLLLLLICELVRLVRHVG